MLRNPDEAETLPMDLAFDVLDEHDMILIWQWKIKNVDYFVILLFNSANQFDQTQDEFWIPSRFL